MKLKLTDNLFLKILSVLVAIILWLLVINISDAEITETYNNVEVSLLNTDVITDNGKVFWVEDGTNYVRVKVRARKSVIDELSASDFVLTADMEKDLKYDSLVGITVECKNRNVVVDEDVTLSRNNVSVSIEDAATEQFPIRVTATGTPNSGLVVGSLTPEQTVIKVTGPASIVEKIKKVEAVVDVTGIPGTAVRNCALKFYDAADNEIDTTYLNYTGKSDGIDVTVAMLNTKSIPLLISYTGTPAENYEVVSVEWKPEYIEIAGNSGVLSEITSLQIPAEAVNVDGISEEQQLVVDITPYLPSGIILEDTDSASVLVIVQVAYVEPEEEGEEESDGSGETDTSEEESSGNTDSADDNTSSGSTNSGTGSGSGTSSSGTNSSGTNSSSGETGGGANSSGGTSSGGTNSSSGTNNSGTNNSSEANNNNDETERGENDKTKNNS